MLQLWPVLGNNSELGHHASPCGRGHQALNACWELIIAWVEFGCVRREQFGTLSRAIHTGCTWRHGGDKTGGSITHLMINYHKIHQVRFGQYFTKWVSMLIEYEQNYCCCCCCCWKWVLFILNQQNREQNAILKLFPWMMWAGILMLCWEWMKVVVVWGLWTVPSMDKHNVQSGWFRRKIPWETHIFIWLAITRHENTRHLPSTGAATQPRW